MMARLVGGLVTLVVGCSLLPEVSKLISTSISLPIEKKHKQTYAEYVQERLEIEERMK